MRFSDHLTETFWAAIDKALPLLYGFGYIFVVVRVLSKNEFGLLGLIELIVYFILMVDNTLAQMPMAKFAAETKESVWAIPNGFFLSFTVLAGCGLACMAGKTLLADLLNAPELRHILWLVPWLLAAGYVKNLTGQICIARQWTGRLVAIDAIYFLGSLTLLAVWQAAGTLASATQVVLANVYLALAASAAGLALTAPVLWRVKWQIRRQDLQRFWAFSRYSFGAGLGAYLNGNVDAILIARFFGPVPLAIYRAGKVIYRFYNAFSQAVQVVILPLASQLAAAGEKPALRALFEKSIYFSCLLLFPLNGLLLLGAEWILDRLYSGQYMEAVPVFRWLLLGAFFLPWGTVGINLLLGAGKPKLSFRITWIVAAINVAASFFLIQAFGIDGAAMAIALTSAAGAVLAARHIKPLTGFTWKGILQRHDDAVNFFKTLWQKTDR
jgi:O-antigen/teichoic acid export membrane protein